MGTKGSLPGLTWWKRNVPYPSGFGFGEWEYVPQPKIQITANNQWWLDKLNFLSDLAAELRWVVRVIGAIVLMTAAVFGSQPSLIQTSLVSLAMVLLIFAFFSFRVVAHAEKVTLASSTPEPNITNENPDVEEKQ